MLLLVDVSSHDGGARVLPGELSPLCLGTQLVRKRVCAYLIVFCYLWSRLQ
jgi:hypothetical protein